MSTIDLKLQLESYLTLKTSLGYSMRAERTLLKNFIEYLEDKNINNSITSQLAVE